MMYIGAFVLIPVRNGALIIVPFVVLFFSTERARCHSNNIGEPAR